MRMRPLIERLATFHLDSTARDSLIQSAVVLIVLGLIRGIVARLLLHRIQSEAMRYRWRKVATYALSTIGLILIGRIWSEGFGTLTTAIGLLSAAIALALRDVVVSFAGWFYILWQRPFQRDMVKSCVWASGGVLGCRDFLCVHDSVFEDGSSYDIG